MSLFGFPGERPEYTDLVRRISDDTVARVKAALEEGYLRADKMFIELLLRRFITRLTLENILEPSEQVEEVLQRFIQEFHERQ